MGGEPHVNQALLCRACSQLPRSVWEASCCFSVFCKGCIRGIYESKCPHCNTRGNAIRFTPNIPLQRIVDDVEVCCIFNGCQKLMRYSQLDDHTNICEYAPVNCDCGQEISLKDLNTHMQSCPKRKVCCTNEGCKEEIEADCIEQHNEICPFLIVSCEYCNTQLQRKNCDLHTDNDCDEAPLQCTFYGIGCKEQLSRKQLPSHLSSQNAFHMELLMRRVTEQQQTIEKLNGKIDEINKEKSHKNSLFEELLTWSTNWLTFCFNYLDGMCCGEDKKSKARRQQQERHFPNLWIFWSFGLYCIICSKFLFPWSLTLYRNFSRFGKREECWLDPSSYLSLFVYCLLMFYYYIFQKHVNVSWKFKCGLSIYFGLVWVSLSYFIIH